MHHLRMTLFLAVTLALAGTSVLAQTINVYGVNTSAFPKITADYVAFDGTGVPITDLTAADFSIVETPQGGTPVNLTASLTHSCVAQNTDPEASIVIILDRSQSMSEIVDGKQRWETAKDAVRAFVNRIKFIGETRVSLVSFAGNYVVINEWVSSAQPILDSLVNLKWQTVTNYELPFDAPSNIFELFKKRPANIPKYCFFLTDGHPNPAIGNEIKFVNDNTQKLQAQGIRFFSVTIKETFTHWTLESLARATGGKAVVTDEKGIIDLFSYLALETQVTKVCQISWIAPYTCNEQGQNRTAVITMKRGANPTATAQYLAPPKSVAKVDVSDPVLFCGDPPQSNASYANVTITAQNATFAATAFNIVPATYFKVVDWNYPLNQPNFTPFNLAPNAKRVIRVQFTQGPTQAFRQAQLSFAGSPCPPNITLVGGTGLILLQSPIGGELFSTCDTVTIKWAGVLPTQPVTLEYSEDNGTTWKSISAAATGLVYKWLPPRAGTAYRVRVSVSPTAQYQWAKQLGGAGAETATSVAVQPNGLKIFASGYFDGPTKIGAATSANMAGNTDGYLAEFDSDGTITNTMLLTGTASNDERVIGVVTDNQGNYYVAGYTSSPTATFGGFSVTPRAPLDTRNMFVFKFAPDGSLAWSNISKGSATQGSWASCTDIGIRYDASNNPEVVIVGQFNKYIEVGVNRGGTIERGGPAAAGNRNYYVVYDVGGYPRITINAAAPTAGVTYKSKRATDAMNFVYDTDSYSGPKSFTPPAITLPNLGLTDVFVSKNGSTPASSAASPTSFTVQAPQLSFVEAKIIFTPDTPIGGVPGSATATLTNTGSFPVTIQAINIVGVNAADFRRTSTDLNQRILPGKTLQLEIAFTPSATGVRTALMEVIGNCNATAQVLLEGNAIAGCDLENSATVNLGKFVLGQGTTQQISCALKNTGVLVVSGKMSIVSKDNDLELLTPLDFVIKPDSCLNLSIDIKAQSAGIKQMTIAFGLPAVCGTQTGTITVEIVEPRVAIDSVDFGRVRVQTPVNDTIVVTNLNNDPAVITAFSLSNPTDPHFVITLPAPQTLPPGASIKIPVVYTPRTRGAHSVNVLGTVQGQAAQLVGEAKGFGFLPAIKAEGYTFNAWTAGATSPETGKVVITNMDNESPLHIERVDFESATTTFAWVGAQPPIPATIQPGGFIELPVSFTPAVVGMNTIRVCVTHDAKPGPGPVPPYDEECVVVSGVGLDQSDLPPVIFPRTLICAMRTDSFTIVNPSNQYPLNVLAPTSTGDASAFIIDQTTDFQIPPSGSKVIRITFQPSAVGLTAATFSFANDQSLKLNVSVSGEGITTPVDFRFNNIVSGTSGQTISTPVVVNYNVADFGNAMPTEFTLTFTHDPDYVRFNSFKAPSMAGWTFTPTINRGNVVVLAQSTGAPLTVGSFVTPAFDIYLNADSSLPVTMAVTTPLSCLIPSGDAGSIEMNQICFTAGRLITIGTEQFSMKSPQSNPVRDRLAVEYSTGFSIATTFQIVDAVGNIVSEHVTPVVPSGVYLLDVSTERLANGVYFLRMNSGPYVASTQFVIVR